MERFSQELFTTYTKLDSKIVDLATNCNCYLIGGTALELWMNHFGFELSRLRSDNDFDFLAVHGEPLLDKFSEGLNKYKANEVVTDSMKSYIIKNPKIEVDLLISYEHVPEMMFYELHGIKVMVPMYMFVSKFQRYVTLNFVKGKKKQFEKDESDLLDLLKLIERRETVNLLETYMADHFTFSAEDEELLNKLIKKFNASKR